MHKAVFLDRDGTITVDHGYTYKIEDLEFFPGVIEGLRLLQQLGFILIIITNQSGIGRKYFTQEECHAFMKNMLKQLDEQGITICAIYLCPHTPEESCNCRKPQLGNYRAAAERYDIDFSQSYVIGDSVNDIQAGIALNTKTILVRTGSGMSYNRADGQPTYTADNLLAAGKWIQHHE
ncbi:MAG: D-glycero-beta-D-manno-heptose 1,7-bisphosphate 7-phosphatase [Patescibacteria group bacterium]